MISPLILKLTAGSALEIEDRAHLARMPVRVRELPGREDIIRQGDAPSDVHLMLSGFSCRYKLMSGGRRSIMAFLVPGDFCDLHAANLDRMDHTIGTLTPCRVVDISRATIEELIAEHPRIAQALRWATLVDEAILREWLANMGQRPSDVQMAHLFCELRRRLAIVGLADRNCFHLPVTQEELADALGISAGTSIASCSSCAMPA